MPCDSCGAEVTDVEPVHRKYVTAAASEQGPSEHVLPDVELWCFACRTHYPHDPA